MYEPRFIFEMFSRSKRPRVSGVRGEAMTIVALLQHLLRAGVAEA